MQRSPILIIIALVGLLGGCSTSAPIACVTVPVNDSTNEPEIIDWLRHKSINVEKDSRGDMRFFDSEACRMALVQYRRLLHEQMSIATENVLNKDVTHDARGRKIPYRRKMVVGDADGATSIVEDQSPFIRRYEPAHPDADASGFVSYPNVDPSIESAYSRRASIEYQAVMRILRRFDPTIVDFDVVPGIPELSPSIQIVPKSDSNASQQP